MKTNFSGRVIQYVEALDFGDAVSNQVLEIDALFKRMGILSLICSKWHHEHVASYRLNLEDISPTDCDVVLVHYAGFSQYVIPFIDKVRCTKVLIYHNITPHDFFDPSTALYDFCLKGREQLKEVIPSFHFFWGDSQYNIDELIAIGTNPEKCSVVPIVVNEKPVVAASDVSRQEGAWIFLGRVAPNKRQTDLVDLFAEVRENDPGSARTLYIVGGYKEDDPYYLRLKEKIKSLGLEARVVVTGKVADEDVNQYLSKASVYVSMSEHEGFGVPLIEAAHHGLPVVALRTSAVGETLGNGAGLAESPKTLGELAARVVFDQNFRVLLLKEQRQNAERFLAERVYEKLEDAIKKIIPCADQFRTVSIVICTFNRADYLERCLSYLDFQTNSNFEVIVINGPSTDGTPDVLRKWGEKIKIGSNPTRNLSTSRNLGIEMSNGDLIAFIDDDALPFDDWVQTILNEYNSRPLMLAGLGGPAYYAGSLEFQCEDIGFNKYAEALLNIESSRVGKDGWERSLLGTNTCFQGDILRRECGFDEQFDYFLDESELCFRLQKHGYLISYSDELFLRHEFAKSENRAGKYKFNWFTICKNTAYFISAYSGLQGNALQSYVADRMRRERIKPLEYAREAGEISSDEFKTFVENIESGWKRGLDDAKDFPKLRQLQKSSEKFRYFPIRTDFPRVGVELPRLHICVITKEFTGFSKSAGGIGTLYYHLMSELLLMGHFVTVITPGDRETVYRRGRFTVRQVVPGSICVGDISAPGFFSNVNWSATALHSLAVAHIERPVDIVESALWDSEALSVALLPKDRRPLVVTRLVTPYSIAAKMNGWDLSTCDASLIRESERRLIENSDAIVAISNAIANTIETEHSITRDHRWSTNYCGIAPWPFFDFRADYATGGSMSIGGKQIGADRKIVLFIGRLEGRKGVDVLLQASNEFLRSSEDACLVFAGRDVEDWRLRANSILEQEIRERVYFAGEVDEQTRERLLSGAYCVVFPSRYESFGLVPLEAFVHGVPVVGARSGAIPEVVVDQECGLLFEPGASSALAECVGRLLLEPSLRDRLARGAAERIKRLSSRNAAIRTVKLYEELLESNQTLH